jgi:hypothetical protein
MANAGTAGESGAAGAGGDAAGGSGAVESGGTSGQGGDSGAPGGTSNTGGSGPSGATSGTGGAGSAGVGGGSGTSGGLQGEAGDGGGGGNGGDESGGNAGSGGTGAGQSGAGGGGGETSGVRFIVTGETGRGNEGQLSVGAAMAAWCETHDCDFAVLLGNNFMPDGVDSTSDAQWQSMFVEPYAGVNAPFYALLGNHDYGGEGAGTEPAKIEHQIDYTAISDKWEMPARYYAFSRPGADFFAADTTPSMFAEDTEQRADFDDWLTGSSATWKIALGHHPYRSNGPHGNAGSYDGLPVMPYDGTIVEEFLRERVCGRADVYLSAHDDSDQWLVERCGVSSVHPGTELIVAGAGASTTTLATSGTGFNAFHFQSLELGFLYVEIVDRTFTGTFVGTDGGVQFTRSFAK